MNRLPHALSRDEHRHRIRTAVFELSYPGLVQPVRIDGEELMRRVDLDDIDLREVAALPEGVAWHFPGGGQGQGAIIVKKGERAT